MGLLYTKMKVFHYKDKVDSLPASVAKVLPPLHVRVKPTNVVQPQLLVLRLSQGEYPTGQGHGREGPDSPREDARDRGGFRPDGRQGRDLQRRRRALVLSASGRDGADALGEGDSVRYADERFRTTGPDRRAVRSQGSLDSRLHGRLGRPELRQISRCRPRRNSPRSWAIWRDSASSAATAIWGW